MNTFKEICISIGFAVMCGATAVACCILTDNAGLKWVRKDGTVVYDNMERYLAKHK